MKTITKAQIEKIMQERRENNSDCEKGLIDYITFTFVDKQGNTFTKDVPSNVCINTEFFTIKKGGRYYGYNNVVDIKCHYSKELAKWVNERAANIKLVNVTLG